MCNNAAARRPAATAAAPSSHGSGAAFLLAFTAVAYARLPADKVETEFLPAPLVCCRRREQ